MLTLPDVGAAVGPTSHDGQVPFSTLSEHLFGPATLMMALISTSEALAAGLILSDVHPAGATEQAPPVPLLYPIIA